MNHPLYILYIFRGLGSNSCQTMDSEKFCLRWNDFESNISSAFKELRDDKDFFDVTLACDDEQLQAHKVILSACSPFFRNVFRRNPHQHPLLYLKGVRYTDLQSVLNFMYHGEVNVAQEELNSFLAVAEDLKVKGLTQSSSGSKNNKRKSSPDPKLQPAYKSSPLIHGREKYFAPSQPSSSLKTPLINSIDDEEIQEVIPVKSEPKEPVTALPPPALEQHFKSQPSQDQAITSADTSITFQEESYEEYGDMEDQAYEGQESFDTSQGKSIVVLISAISVTAF